MNLLSFMNYNNSMNKLKLRSTLSDNIKISHNYFQNQCIEKNIDLNLIGAAVLIPFIVRENSIDILLTTIIGKVIFSINNYLILLFLK